MTATARLSDLSPAAAVLIGAAAFAVGIAINVDNAKFFAHGIELIMPEGALRDTRIEAGYLMVVAELLFFFIAALVRGPGSTSWRAAFTAMALSLAAFETVTIYSTQAAIGRAGVNEVTGADSRIEQLQASIAAHRRNAAALLEAGQHSSQSVIAASRADGARSIRDAAALEAQAQRMAADLAALQASRRPTMESILGEDGAQAHNAAFAILLMLSGMLLTSSAGWFVGNARMGWAARKLGDAGRWARDGAAKVAVPAAAAGVVAMSPAAFAAPAPFPAPQPMTTTMPSPGAIRYSAPVAAVPTVTTPSHLTERTVTEPSQSMREATVTDSSQSSDQTVTEPSQSQPAKKARQPRAARVPVGHKLDTGVGPDDGHRYRRIRDAVIAGQIKPSVRAIFAKEGGGNETVRAYLQQLEREGIVARLGRGYRLVARPNTVPEQGELL